MTTDATRWARVSRAFDAAVELPHDERAAALDRLCRHADGRPDPDLRAEVEAMLEADDRATLGGTLGGGVANAAVLVEAEPVAGERVGPWRVVREVGRGGMGRVDLVERADGAYEQRAALKRLGLVAPERVRRFARERQILATLEHPGIARLLDGGVAADGTPYLVMEYVEGEPITTWAEDRGLGLEARLRLFLQVCDAVAFAHRHLVVHRDLKPSNVLVSDRPTAEREGTGGTESARVTLLDFGIARLLDAEDDGAPLTLEGPGAPLTPGYAAPEQAEGGAVTTATDVYALGVLLYELLTGRRPVEASTRGAWLTALRETDPKPPSQVAGVEARRLRGDLDAIALTALRREPEARYPSAHDLAADLRRHLAGEAVAARPPSAWYRASRFARRHTTAVASVALVFLAVVVGGAATAWQAREARAAAAESAATAAFLAGLFEGADPTATGDSLLAVDLLERGTRRIDHELAEQPGVRAALYTTVGEAYLGLGHPDSAAAFARRALALRGRGGAATDAEAAVEARLLLGRALFRTDPTEAATVLEEAVAEARALDDRLLLDALEVEGELVGAQVLPPAQTVAVLEEAVALSQRLEGEDHPRTGRLLALLATKVASAHQHGRIEPLLRDALARLPAETNAYHRSTALIDLAELLDATGRSDEAAAAAAEALALRRRVLGPGDVRTAEALAVRAAVAQGDPSAAEADAREAIAIAEAAGAGAILVEVLNPLARALMAQDRFDEAAAVYARRFRLAGEVYGTGGTRYPAASVNVGRALHAAGRYDEAAAAWAESLGLLRGAYGPESPVVASTLVLAGRTAEAAGRLGAAEAFFQEAYDASRSFQPSSRTRALSAMALGRVRLDRGRAEAAVEPLREAVEAREVLGRPAHGFDEADDDRAVALLGEALVATGALEAGRPRLAEGAAGLEAALGPDHPHAARARAALRRARG